MRSQLILLGVLLSFYFSYAQNLLDNNLIISQKTSLQVEISRFIKNNPERPSSKEYAVYIINLYETDDIKGDYSLAMGVILNEKVYDNTCVTHYFE